MQSEENPQNQQRKQKDENVIPGLQFLPQRLQLVLVLVVDSQGGVFQFLRGGCELDVE